MEYSQHTLLSEADLEGLRFKFCDNDGKCYDLIDKIGTVLRNRLEAQTGTDSVGMVYQYLKGDIPVDLFARVSERLPDDFFDTLRIIFHQKSIKLDEQVGYFKDKLKSDALEYAVWREKENRFSVPKALAAQRVYSECIGNITPENVLSYLVSEAAHKSNIDTIDAAAQIIGLSGLSATSELAEILHHAAREGVNNLSEEQLVKADALFSERILYLKNELESTMQNPFKERLLAEYSVIDCALKTAGKGIKSRFELPSVEFSGLSAAAFTTHYAPQFSSRFSPKGEEKEKAMRAQIERQGLLNVDPSVYKFLDRDYELHPLAAIRT